MSEDARSSCIYPSNLPSALYISEAAAVLGFIISSIEHAAVGEEYVSRAYAIFNGLARQGARTAHRDNEEQGDYHCALDRIVLR